jgi:hypothetical protein
VFLDGLEVFGVKHVRLFMHGIIGLLGVAFGLDDCLLVGLLCKVFSLMLYKFNYARVSGKRGVVRSYDGFHNLVEGLLALRVDPSDDFFFEFPDLGIEYGCSGCIDILVSILESGFIMVLSDGEVVDLKALQALVPFGGMEREGVVKVAVEGCNHHRQAV